MKRKQEEEGFETLETKIDYLIYLMLELLKKGKKEQKEEKKTTGKIINTKTKERQIISEKE